MYALFSGDHANTANVEEHLDGNLCRCTGYRPIWDAARALCDDAEDALLAPLSDGEGGLVRGPCGVPCRECPERNECEMECNLDDKAKEKKAEVGGDVGKEKKEEGGGGAKVKVCTSTSLSKVREFRSSLEDASGKGQSWRMQPDDMFPSSLSDPSSSVFEETSKPLAVVDDSRSHPGSKGGTWFGPKTLREMLRLLADGVCKIVAGNTEVGIEAKFKDAHYARLVHPSPSIGELNLVDVAEDGSALRIGACAPLSDIQETCDGLASGSAAAAVKGADKIAAPIRDMLRWFASTQIRNAACLGGNLATASPISDMNPLLAALGAELVVSSLSDGSDEVRRRRVPVSTFFKSYRTVDLQPNELIERVDVPVPREGALEYCSAFKQARRREDDISIVTSGMRIVLETDSSAAGYTVKDLVLAFGGMAPTTILPPTAASSMLDKPFEEATFVEGGKALMEELKLPEDVPGGQAQYRATLAASFLRKFYLQTAEKLAADIALQKEGGKDMPAAPSVSEEDKSGGRTFLSEGKPSSRGVQKYPAPRAAVGLEEHRTDGKMGTTKLGDELDIPQVAMAALAAAKAKGKETAGKHEHPEVGKPSPHASAPLHCTGEALYTDDVPLPPSTLHAALVLATKCNVTLLSLDPSPAFAIPGVAGVYCHGDLVELGGDNKMGPIKSDESVFLSFGDKVGFVGQVLGICVGETLEAAQRGAKAVAAEYGEEEGETVVSIEQAIAAGSFYDFARHTLEHGDVESALADVPPAAPDGSRLVTVNGSFRCGGQEHFYLETNSTLAVPSESGSDLTVYCSTQSPTKTQMYCASAAGMQASRVVVRMKRMGGGFGGKETRSVFASAAASVAAVISNRPVRLTLDRDVDMSITGGRHSFLANYRASAAVSTSENSNSIKLQALDVQLYSNGGTAFDLSGPVMDRALFHVDGCYRWPNFRAVGVPCKTAQAPHTAFRGFGGPQGIAVCEHVVDHLAVACGVSGDELRRSNMYRVGESLPFGMRIGEEYSGRWNVPGMWDRLHRELDVAERRRGIEEFNEKNTYVKRGLSFVPTKFGIAFTAKFMNQGGALVHLYTDGTVLVTHGGTEMGQGLHTKVCQIAAQAFDIPLSDVYINDTSTDKIANSIPTAASMSTDMYGMATLDACRQILRRIEPIRVKLAKEGGQDPQELKLKEVAQAAHFELIDLSAHGFFALDNSRCGFDWDKTKPEDCPDNAPQNSWKGHPFNYFTQGVACAEVEVDVLTGDHRTVAVDLLVDVGSSVNPAIDVGQVEGAFIQGMGWSTLEELVYSDEDHTWVRPKGKLFTAGPGTYKIPAFNDVPESFNVTLLEDAENPFAVHSSKAVGEPPFFLGTSVFYALKDAVRAARMCRKKEHGSDADEEKYFEMRMPATSERVRMFCADDIAIDSIAIGRGGSGDSKEEAVNSFEPKGSH
eukprot:CAMPEP_0113545998 /NCGR_PEP_ID=MMETSP0015_2-20120614/11568_1 /TAXON_ID=2838 /ORGANISM="Odontella" /LENGTH=1428 /DNA_ID=CAMNT_0000446417 /DNA_START=478 /DNA_END=4764 /DNA_ORIENTATION=- /assembly_acc=CAM_ASM_000160